MNKKNKWFGESSFEKIRDSEWFEWKDSPTFGDMDMYTYHMLEHNIRISQTQFYKCPNCDSYLSWYNAIYPLFCRNCLLLDTDDSGSSIYHLPSLSDVKLPNSQPFYEETIYNQINKSFEKDVRNWNENDFLNFCKIKNLEDKQCKITAKKISEKNDIIALEHELFEPRYKHEYSFINNPVIKLCLIKYFLKKEMSYLIELGDWINEKEQIKGKNKFYNWNNNLRDDEENSVRLYQYDNMDDNKPNYPSGYWSFSPNEFLTGNYCFGGILLQCISYKHKVEMVSKKMDPNDYIPHLKKIKKNGNFQFFYSSMDREKKYFLRIYDRVIPVIEKKGSNNFSLTYLNSFPVTINGACPLVTLQHRRVAPMAGFDVGSYDIDFDIKNKQYDISFDFNGRNFAQGRSDYYFSFANFFDLPIEIGSHPQELKRFFNDFIEEKNVNNFKIEDDLYSFDDDPNYADEIDEFGNPLYPPPYPGDPDYTDPFGSSEDEPCSSDDEPF